MNSIYNLKYEIAAFCLLYVQWKMFVLKTNYGWEFLGFLHTVDINLPEKSIKIIY